MSRIRSTLVIAVLALPGVLVSLSLPALAANVVGTSGDDQLVGTAQADRISGLSGADDILFGGDDGNAVYVGPGYDRVWHGGHLDPKDRFHGCDEFSNHP